MIAILLVAIVTLRNNHHFVCNAVVKILDSKGKFGYML